MKRTGLVQTAEMFCFNVFSLMSGFVKSWSARSVSWFLGEIKPLLDTSKQFSAGVRCAVRDKVCIFV